MTITTIYYCSTPSSFPLKQSKNNGITNTKMGMPAKFQGADGGASFAIGRNQYKNQKTQTNTTLSELYEKQKFANRTYKYIG